MRRLLVAHRYAPLLDHCGASIPPVPFLLLASSRPAADEAIWTLSAGGVLGAHRTTLAQMARDLALESLAAEGLAPLTPLATEALIARATDEIRRRQQFERWREISTLPGFVRAVRATLDELLKHGVDSEGWAAHADLARLMAEFAALRARNGLAHAGDIFRRAMAAPDHPSLGLPLVALDCPLRYRLEAELARRLAERAPSVTVLHLAADSESIAKWARILDVEPQLLDAPGPGSLGRVQRCLFSTDSLAATTPDESLRYFAAPGENFECVEIARRIQALAAEGVRLDEIAILLRRPDIYRAPVEEALRRASLPVYFAHGTVRPDPAGRAFLALLDCALERLSASRFAEYLSFAQTPREEGVKAPFAWERLIVDAAVIGGADRWRRRLQGLLVEIDLQLLELGDEDDARRESLARRREQLVSLAEFALPVIERLGKLPAQALWAEWNGHLAELAENTLADPAGVLDLLQELRVMDESGPVNLEEVALTLRGQLGDLRREPPPRRYGCVFAGSIEEARGRCFRFVFIPGLGEGHFPKRVLEDPLLLDEHRLLLSPDLDTNSRRAEQERLLLRIAAGAATERLTISYSTMDTAQARARVPSFYALETLRAATGEFPRLASFEREARASASAGLGWPAPAEPSDAIDDAEYDLAVLHRSQQMPARQDGAAWYMIEANTHLGRSLRSRYRRWEAAWSNADGLVSAHQALEAHRLLARPHSATRLQQFAACPYRFVLASIHGLAPRARIAAIEQLDPLTRGTLFHEVQNELIRSLRDRELLPVTPANLDACSRLSDELLGRIAARYEDDLAPAIPRVWRSEIDALRGDLRGWLRELAHQPGWLPLETEVSFGERDSSRPPVTILSRLQLRGRIDLVEESLDRSSLRVTDHKTGRAPKAPPAAIGGGAVLQPLLYARAAAELFGREVRVSRLFYATARGGYEQHHFQLTDAAFAQLERALRIIDGYIESGFLPPYPADGACDVCDFRPVCGPYEPVRTARKNRQGAGQLIQLRELP